MTHESFAFTPAPPPAAHHASAIPAGEPIEREPSSGAPSPPPSAPRSASPLSVAICANFTADPIRDVLAFWLRTLELDAAVSFAPYNQVMLQLLDPESLLSRETDGIRVLLLRHDVFDASSPSSSSGAAGTASGPATDTATGTDGTAATTAASTTTAATTATATAAADAIDRIAAAVDARARASGGSWVIVCCPPVSPEAVFSAAQSAALDRRLAQALQDTPGVEVIGAAHLLRLYPVPRYHDAEGGRLGDMPYSEPFFAALGTMIARAVHAVVTPPRKVIVLDCDNTLWQGVCGEASVAELAIDAPRRFLQAFLVEQMRAGALLCLCSRNEEADVWRVFDTHPDMVLRRDQIVASRINWQPKADNLRDLARELSLALDTFVLLDDDPVECAAVRVRLPEVVTLRVPADAADIPRLLEHVWALDRPRPTAEDRTRTAQYLLQRRRERDREQAPTQEDFVRALGVRTTVAPAESSHLARIAQLTYRTTQFNATLRRRSEGELRRLHGRADTLLLSVHVSDRYGDYGLVGAIVGCVRGGVLEIENFLLSCRALGRRVEHDMLRALDAAARTQRCTALRLSFVEGDRNQVARTFFDSPAAGWIRDAGPAAAPAATGAPAATDAPEAPGASAASDLVKAPAPAAALASCGYRRPVPDESAPLARADDAAACGGVATSAVAGPVVGSSILAGPAGSPIADVTTATTADPAAGAAAPAAADAAAGKEQP